jgi:hypothetical protein
MRVHLLDVEWLLSTLFDASLLKLRAAGNGGSFFTLAGCASALRDLRVSRAGAGARASGNYVAKLWRRGAGQEITAG